MDAKFEYVPTLRLATGAKMTEAPFAHGQIDMRFVERPDPNYVNAMIHGEQPMVRVLQSRVALLAAHQHGVHGTSFPALEWGPWTDVRTEKE